MSTNADCKIYETEDGWFYALQQYPYGDTPDYDTFGPFNAFGAAMKHLDDHHANPGGFTRDPIPGCEHPPEYRRKRWMPGEWECWLCGYIYFPDSQEKKQT